MKSGIRRVKSGWIVQESEVRIWRVRSQGIWRDLKSGTYRRVKSGIRRVKSG